MKRWLLATTLLSTLVIAPNKADADPITMAVAAVSTATSVAAAGGIAAATFLGLTGAGAVFAQFAVRAALGYALNALTPKPRGVTTGGVGDISSSGVGYGAKVNSLGAALPHAVIYGEPVVGGAVFYQAVTGTSNEYLHRCIAFAGHEVDSYTTFYLNGEAVTLDGAGNVTAPSQYAGFVRISEHLGTDDQTADSDLVSAVTEWTTDHRARGVAYAYIRYTYDATAFANGVPVLTAKIKGKKVYDPRTGITAWSNNPALCLRDYISSEYGLGEASSEINDDLVNDAADICDQDVSGDSRYTCDGAILLDAEPQSIISSMLASMGGLFWFAQGQWGMKAASYLAPTLTFTEDDLRGELNIATRNSRRDNFNSVTGIYRGDATEWQESEFEPITNATYLAEDNGVENSIDMQLLFSSKETTARRIANIALERNRRQITVSAPFGLKALQVGIGDTIKLTNARAGFNEKVFEVNDWRFAMTEDMDLQVSLLLREIDSGVFA